MNPAKNEQTTGGERAGSPKKPSAKSRPKITDSPSSLGDTTGQAPAGNPIPAPVGAQATGVDPTTRSSGTPAGTGRASGGGGDADATNVEMVDRGIPTKPLTTYPSAYKPSTTVLPSSDTSVRPLKASSASVHAERQKAQAQAAAEARAIAEAGNTGEGGPDDIAPPGVVRQEDQDPNALQGIPRPLPGLPKSRSSTLNSQPPEEGVESQERDLADAGNVDSDGYFNDEDDEIYEDARAIAEKLNTPGFKESLTLEEYEALRYQQFQLQQQEANRQMYVQQQQLLEAMAPKPDNRSTTTVLGIGMGGSSDEPQSSKEKSLRRKISELEFALQSANSSAMNLDHHYRKLWDRAKAQGEELQRSQHQNHRSLDDNRSLMHELEAVKVQLVDAKKLSEMLMILVAPKTLLEVRGKKLKVDTTDVDLKTNEETWDMLGGADILLTAAAIQMVDVLNVEVGRVAAALGKVLQNTKFEEGHRQIMQITEKARLMLGENMVALLSAGLPEKARADPLLVQVVLQVAIINWCKTTISSWKPGNSVISNLLVELYSKIREVGKSASTFKNNPPLRQKYLSFQKIQRSTIVGGQ